MVIPGIPHHVTQRGNNKQDVFFVDDDRRVYLELLGEQAERFGVEVMGHCLMSNHVHLIAMPRQEESLAKAVGRTHFLYTQYINQRHDREGHLWRNRFYSCGFDEAHTVAAMSCIERNPVRARLAGCAWDYEWSSARAHVGEEASDLLVGLGEWLSHHPPAPWREVLLVSPGAETEGALRSGVSRGWPLGSDNLVSKFERLLGRRLRPCH